MMRPREFPVGFLLGLRPPSLGLGDLPPGRDQ